MCESSHQGRLRMIVDADTGADDALSLLIGCVHADVALICCCDGNVDSNIAADNTLRLLSAIEFADKIPVAVGPSASSSKGRHWGRHFADVFVNKPTQQLCSRLAAQEMVAAALKEVPNTVTLVCTGPLSNIGEAIRYADETACLDRFLDSFRKVVIMGGLCNPDGYPSSLPSNAEFNIRASVMDSRAVWEAPWPTRIEFVLVPIDPVVRSPLKYADAVRVKSLSTNKSAAAWAVLDFHVKQDETMVQAHGYEIYDAFAMAVAINPFGHTLVNADVTLCPTGQLIVDCIGKTPSNEQTTQHQEHERKQQAQKQTQHQPGHLELQQAQKLENDLKSQTPSKYWPCKQSIEWSVSRNMAVLEDINYTKFFDLFLAAMLK
eukprot:m.85270 g.85270  ORF g.85270 m.85270 type:complete len:377 (+) comp25854_c0_seq2:236-1366(+)